MGMVVRTNTMALNAYRQLGMNNSAVAKSLEKLSSGFRINRAGDDAAGLAISEKMKAQITGLETASANAQDGISLIQTAEGNLTEVHSMLNRMVELATKSANGTYTATERDALQDEVDALLEEIDRISQSANFNGTRLLDGSMGLNADAFTIGEGTSAVAAGKIALNGLPTSVGTDETKVHLNQEGKEQQGGKFAIDLADYELDLTNATGTVGLKFGIAGVEQVIEIDTATAGNAKVWKGNDLAKEILKSGTWVRAANAPAQTDELKYAWLGKIADGDTNEALYKVTADGTKLVFEYAGASKNKDQAADTDEITDAMLAADQRLDKTVTIGVVEKATLPGTTVEKNFDGAGYVEKNMSYHGVVDITPMQKAVEGQRAGIEFDLSANPNLFQDGAQLVIDEKTFTFKLDADKADTDYDGVVIDLSDVKIADGATDAEKAMEYAKAAAIKLSNETTDSFVIGDAGSGKIKVDQTVDDYDGGNNAPYTSLNKLTSLFSANVPAKDATSKLTVTDGSIKSGDAINIGGTTYKFVDKVSDKVPQGTVEILKDDGVNGLVTELKKSGFTVDNKDGTLTISKAGKDAPAIIGGGLTLQIGDTADAFNKMNVSVADMSAAGLGLKGLKITSETEASDAIAKIKTAVNTVSTARAGMGALQNRLEHTINNLDVAVENLSAANSRIRDTDMAKEMMNYTKMNVLVQSAQAMLAQANQQPQSVLQLLQ